MQVHLYQHITTLQAFSLDLIMIQTDCILLLQSACCCQRLYEDRGVG